jgi:hypothetical protein
VVVPARGAVACRSARHRVNLGVAAGVERPGDLPCPAPGAVHLADNERLKMPGTVPVRSACAAVARRRARHPGDLGVSAGVEGRGHLPGVAPRAVALAGDPCLAAGGAGDVSARAAVARRSTRHRPDLRRTTGVQGRGARDLLRLPPGTARGSGAATSDNTRCGGGIRPGGRRGSAERQDQCRRGTSGQDGSNQVFAHVNWCLLGRLPWWQGGRVLL